MKKQVIIEIISFLFILLFMYAAVSKLIDVEKFKIQIHHSEVLAGFANWITWTVPLAEILIAIMLAIPPVRRIGLYAAFGLMVMFTAYIVSILYFSDVVPCSCGGILEKMGWTEHLVFNVCFVFLGIFGILLHSKGEEPQKENESVVV